MRHSALHRRFLPDAFAEPSGALSKNHGWKPSPSINWSQASPFQEWEGVIGQGTEEDGERGEGNVMTSGLDTALGRSTQYSSCGDRPPHSTHTHTYLEHL